MSKPTWIAISCAWVIFGAIMIGRYSGWWTLMLGSLSLAVGVAMVASPPENR